MNRMDVLHLTFGVSREGAEQLERFVERVEQAPMNLTAWRGDTLWERGVYDSLALGVYLGDGVGRALDIGSGGGFPGMVLAVRYPEVQWVLLDSRERRCGFLLETARHIGLVNVEVVQARAEQWVREGEGCREAFDAVTMRAVAPLGVSLELGLPYVRQGGRLLMAQGPGGPQEFQQHDLLLRELGGNLFGWHTGMYQRNDGHADLFLVIEKVRRTPEAFPRGAKNLGERTV